MQTKMHDWKQRLRDLLTPAARDGLTFVAIGVCVAALVFAVSSAIDPVFPKVKERMDVMAERADEIDVLSVGHSHNMVVAFDTMDVDGFHIWRPSEDVFEAEYRLRHALEQLPELDVVIIAVSYWHFRRDNTAGEQVLPAYFSERRRELYHIVPPVSIDHPYIAGDLNHFVRGKLAPLVRADHFKGVLEELVSSEAEDPSVLPTGRLKVFDKPMTDEELREKVDGKIEHAMGLQKTMTDYREDLVDDSYATLSSMVERLEAEGIDVLFFTPPYYHVYTERFDSDTQQEMKRLMRRMEAEHPNARYLDHSTDSYYIFRPEIFRDNTHMNIYGSREFSKDVIEPELQERGNRVQLTRTPLAAGSLGRR